MFIFDSCRLNLAAVTPVNYECCSKNLIGSFIYKIENFPNGEIKELNFSDLHPDLLQQSIRAGN